MYTRRLLSLDEARRVGDAALAKAMEHPHRPMSIDEVSDQDVALAGARALQVDQEKA